MPCGVSISMPYGKWDSAITRPSKSTLTQSTQSDHQPPPNPAVEPTSNSFRSCVAPAIGRGSPLALAITQGRNNQTMPRQKKAQETGRLGERWFPQQLPANWIFQPPHEDVG